MAPTIYSTVLPKILLLPEIEISSNATSVIAFMQIINYNHFRQHILSITYDCSILNGGFNLRGRWAAAIQQDDFNYGEIERHDHGQSISHYQNMLRDQNLVLEANLDLELLRNVISRLPRLKSFTITNSKEAFTQYGFPFSATSIAASRISKAFFEGIEASTQDPNASHHPRLHELIFEDIPWEQIQGIFDNRQYHCLTRIVIHVLVDPNSYRSDSSQIKQYLGSLQGLQQLDLGFHCKGWRTSYIPLEDIVDVTKKWPVLREVVLGGFESREQNVLELLRHNDSICNFSMRSMFFSGSRRIFLSAVHGVLKLDKTEIRGLLSGN